MLQKNNLQKSKFVKLQTSATRCSRVCDFQTKPKCTTCNQFESAGTVLMDVNRSLNTIIKSVERITKHVTAEEKEEEVRPATVQVISRGKTR